MMLIPNLYGLPYIIYTPRAKASFRSLRHSILVTISFFFVTIVNYPGYWSVIYRLTDTKPPTTQTRTRGCISLNKPPLISKDLGSSPSQVSTRYNNRELQFFFHSYSQFQSVIWDYEVQHIKGQCFDKSLGIHEIHFTSLTCRVVDQQFIAS